MSIKKLTAYAMIGAEQKIQDARIEKIKAVMVIYQYGERW